MVFTLGLRHTFHVWSRGLALVQFLVVQTSLASCRAVANSIADSSVLTDSVKQLDTALVLHCRTTSQGFASARNELDPKPVFKGSRFMVGGGRIVYATSVDMTNRVWGVQLDASQFPGWSTTLRRKQENG